jgi:hypothetical protein
MYIDAKREKAEKRTRSAASAGVIIKKGVPPLLCHQPRIFYGWKSSSSSSSNLDARQEVEPEATG